MLPSPTRSTCTLLCARGTNMPPLMFFDVYLGDDKEMDLFKIAR